MTVLEQTVNAASPEELILRGAFDVVCEDTSAITRAEWLKLRKTGLGSSDVAAALSMTPWSSPYALYCDKRDLVPDQDDSEFFAWKRHLETPILNWAAEHGWVSRPGRRHVMLRSQDHPFLIADPDELTPDEVVEAKTASGFDERRWNEGAPDQYAIQAHVLMIVTGRRRCCMPVAFDTKPPVEYWIDWDAALAGTIIEKAGAFWQQIQDGVEPDPDASQATMHALRDRWYQPPEAKSVELEPAQVTEWLQVRKVAIKIGEVQAEVSDGVKTRLMALMGDAEEALVFGDVVATWKWRRDGVRVFRFAD